MRFVMCFLVCGIWISLITSGFCASFLFDAGKAESSGDADWVIDASNSGGYAKAERYPVPDQCMVSSTTAETFWRGGYSAWAIDLVKNGHHVESLPIATAITYGSCSNPQDLSHYDVYIIPEPQVKFYDDQKQAIFDFVYNGGGLFIIANHCGSDRNNNGWDSPMIFNDMGCEAEFGIHFEVDEGSGTNKCHFSNGGCSNFRDDDDDPILHGPYGTINPIGLHDATTLTLHPENNSSVHAIAWQNDKPQSNSYAVLAYATYGMGRVLVLTDSAPADDGTGDPDDDLVNGWSQNRKLILNASAWLAQVPGMGQYSPCPHTTPTPTCPAGTYTPSPVSTRTPTPIPTYSFEINVMTNQLNYAANDHFLLTVTKENPGPALMVDQYVILDVYGHYYFHPNWTEDMNNTNLFFNSGTNGPDTILDFIWPAGAGSFSATFWGAITRAGDIYELWDYDYASFTAE